MPAPNEAAAVRAARELLTELEIGSYPIQPDKIAAAKRLRVDYQDGFPAGVFGALWRAGNDFGIVVSNACPTMGHRRFTLAHELGHYHIEGHVEQLFRGADGQALS